MTKPARLRAVRALHTTSAHATAKPEAAPTAMAFVATPPSALLLNASLTIAERGRLRDSSAGQGETIAERSMAATVSAFNALEGAHLTEAQGWRFMQVLKLARAAASERNGTHHMDDYLDGAAYAALANEAAEHAAQAAQLSGARTDPGARP